MLGKRKWVLIGIFFLILLGSLYFQFRGELGKLDVRNIADFLRELGPWAMVIGGGLIVIQTFFPVVPFILLVGANVLVFGLWGGFWITWISAVLASVLMFYSARTVGRDWAKRKMQAFPKINNLNQFLEQNGFKTVLSLRLFPILPPVLVNLAAGLSAIEARAYILATSIGKVPTIFIHTVIGNDLLHFSDNKLRLVLIVIGFGLILVIGMTLLRKKMKLS